MSAIVYTDEVPSASQYLSLFETTGWNAVYKLKPDDALALLQRSWYIVSAYDGDKLIATGRLVSDGVLYAMVCDMIVEPSYQQRGFGTAILQKLIERCTNHGIRDIQLFAAKGKVSFYSKRGFVERPTDAPGMRYCR